MTLRRIREALALTRSAVAELLDMDQSEVSRLERRSDMPLSTLTRSVVTFPDGSPVELLVGDR